MKKLLFASCMFFYSLTANADVDYTVTWQLANIPDVNAVKLDLDIGNAFVGAHGALILSNGAFLQITGTCQIFSGDVSFQCILYIANGDRGVLQLNQDLNGTWRTVNVNGDVVDFVTASISEVEEAN